MLKIGINKPILIRYFFVLMLNLLSYGHLVSQSYIVWDSDGEYLSNFTDSLEMISSMEKIKSENFHVLLSQNSSFVYKDIKLKYKMFLLYNSTKVKLYNDSIPDGKWLVYFKDSIRIQLRFIKEVANSLYENYFVHHIDTNYISITQFRGGYNIGQSKVIDRRGKPIYLSMYDDSLHILIFSNRYDLDSFYLVDSIDCVNNIMYEFYENGKLKAKCPLNMNDLRHGEMILYSKEGIKIRSIFYENGIEIK